MDLVQWFRQRKVRKRHILECRISRRKYFITLNWKFEPIQCCECDTFIMIRLTSVGWFALALKVSGSRPERGLTSKTQTHPDQAS